MRQQFIHVRPAPGLRRDFAVWAVSQTPKVATSSPSTFAVPLGLVAGVPEGLLCGALLDGQPYVPAYATGQTPPDGPDFSPLEDAPAEDAAAEDAPDGETQTTGYPCPDCQREYTTARSLNRHRDRAHKETTDGV